MAAVAAGLGFWPREDAARRWQRPAPATGWENGVFLQPRRRRPCSGSWEVGRCLRAGSGRWQRSRSRTQLGSAKRKEKRRRGQAGRQNISELVAKRAFCLEDGPAPAFLKELRDLRRQGYCRCRLDETLLQRARAAQGLD